VLFRSLARSGRLPRFNAAPRQRSLAITSSFRGQRIKVRPAFSPALLTPPEFSTELDEILNLIRQAEKEVLVSVMQYSVVSPYTSRVLTDIDFALREASFRGVAVKLLFTDWAHREPNISHIKSLACLPKLEVRTSSIPRLKNRYIPFARVSHCKFMVADHDKAWLGTTNWEPDYFLSSRNMSVVLEGKSANKKLRELFFNTWNQPFSHPVEPGKQYKRPQQKK
jgi:phosphatidylserine/phosphatidylglycerophosphate/cardiolipin synthase-like enzyme